MTPQFLNLGEMRTFLATINPQLAEDPPSFDWVAYRGEAEHLASELLQRLNREYRLSDPTWIQDSTHGAEIAIPLDVLCEEEGVHPAIRISKHGHLVTITCERKVQSGTLAQIRDAIHACGYVFVPEAVFGGPFDMRDRFNGDLFNQLFDYV